MLMYLFFFSSSVLNAATLLSALDFESGVLKKAACSGNCPTDSSALKTAGRFSAQFSLTRAMPTSFRTEAVLKQHGSFEKGKEYWVGFDYYHHNWDKDREEEIGPFQIHGKASDWSFECTRNRYAPFHMVTKNGQETFMTYGNNVMWSGSVVKNQWQRIIFHFKLSAGSDGFIEAWKDGVKLGRVNGQNDQALDSCGRPTRSSYLKIGVYKGVWRPGKRETDVNRRDLFIDSLKIAEGSNGYFLVDQTSFVFF